MSREMYDSVCKPEFEGIKSDCSHIKDDIGKIKEKVFNGFGESISRTERKVDDLEKQVDKRMNRLDARMWGLFIGIFMMLLAQIIPQFLHAEEVQDPVIVERVNQ